MSQEEYLIYFIKRALEKPPGPNTSYSLDIMHFWVGNGQNKEQKFLQAPFIPHYNSPLHINYRAAEC